MNAIITFLIVLGLFLADWQNSLPIIGLAALSYPVLRRFSVRGSGWVSTAVLIALGLVWYQVRFETYIAPMIQKMITH
jgi:hypothetical protein